MVTRVKYDPYGRVVKAYYPTVETNLNNKLVFNATFDGSASPTSTTYDVLDRATSVIQPDNSTTSTSYSLDVAGKLLKTTVTDALGKTQATFTNGSGQTCKTEQYSGPNGTITTTYAYDAINQLLSVTDTKGTKTESVYDLAGRRTKLIHPASGATTFRYDYAGNLISKQTANLAQSHDSITYTYKYNRLESIHYPKHPENDVTYTYGTISDAGASNGNRAGRLKYLIDGSGAQEYKYGRMGEVTEVRRTLIIPNQTVATYVTGWTYDSWNRVRTMTYPDGESLSYSYNLGGMLSSLSGTKGSYTYPYVKSITYDKFEQRTYIKYGNDAETRYTYNPSTRNLSNLSVISTKLGSRTLMNNAYAYDMMDNVLSVTNSAPVPGSGIGGSITHNYSYDGLYRLTGANGTYAGNSGKTASYTLSMTYDNLYNITGKDQSLVQNNVQFTGTLKAGYGLGYTYNPSNNQQLMSIADTSYRTTGAIVKTARRQAYTYDANGNLLSVYTTQPVTNDGQMSKHIYVGSQRIASQLCSSGSTAADPQTLTRAAASQVNYTTKYAELTAKVPARYDSLDVPYHGKDNAGSGFWTASTTVSETDQYYYHPDHLGSSSLITIRSLRSQIATLKK